MKTLYTLHDSPFGPCIIGGNAEGICELSFVDASNEARTRALPTGEFFSGDTSLPLNIQGTSFQLKVWDALLKIPKGQTRSYAEIASVVGSPKAVRAVGTACGKNKIALLIPCHRVLGSKGKLGGYRWGTERKRAILDWEATLDRVIIKA